MRSYETEHRGLRISCRTTGRGDAVVFLHADFVDSRMWDGVMSALDGAYSMTAYDKLGYGSSDRATGPLCRRKELGAVMETVGAAPVHLVGCSNGGRQALDYALENPERVRSLCLVNSTPSGFAPEGQPPEELLEMIQASREGRIAETNELQIRIWFDGPGRSPDSMDAARLAARDKAKAMNRIFLENGTFPTADMNPLDPLDPPAIGRLGNIRVPVLVLSGALDYGENRRASRVLAEGVPGARFVEMDGCAHAPPLEDPAKFSGILAEFLASA